MYKSYIEAMIYLAKNLLSSLEDARDMLIDETNENSPKPCASGVDTENIDGERGNAFPDFELDSDGEIRVRNDA